MGKYVLRRALTATPTVFLVTILAFSIILMLPGDPALAILGEELARDKVLYQTLRDELGLDRPIPVQYWDWLTKAATGDRRADRQHREKL